ncbi:hypothetical protein POM88_002460 [Heracleum sosnowskyi]|uniref:Peptidase C19 ubiquitin carboxyl-terminal hydrolase domain-containing protein n=1 Tax=Heracleum sosnowskyi TaxID=360622 RepID=A0AAD8N5Y1_9APIA|nr:hypothetical protein POM88_002460 [Heracleum sosnowskyi]
MGDPLANQVFVFGSFSEDEARNLLHHFDGELSVKLPTCSNGLSNFKPECKVDRSGNLKENGDIGKSLDCSSLSSGNEGTMRNEGSDLRSVNGTSHGGLQKQCRKASAGPAKMVVDLRPRGLINSGNLCFLNAALQALLSCSPLVKLLLELRNRSISKVNYPTLAAFVDFVSVLEPNGITLKKKDIPVLETGSLSALRCSKVFLKFLLQMYLVVSQADQGKKMHRSS